MMINSSTESSPLSPDLETQERRQCCRIIDYSEPCIWAMGLLGVVGVVVGLIPPSALILTIAVSLLLLAIVSSWRVRVLGTAYALMQSIDDLREENDRLAAEIDEFETVVTDLNGKVQDLESVATTLESSVSTLDEGLVAMEVQNRASEVIIEDLKGIIGLVGDGVHGVEESTARIMEAYEKYKTENLRQEKNNLMALFDVIDRDKDGNLDNAEMRKLQDYVMRAYGRDISEFDTDEDGIVSFQEFVTQIT